MNEPDYDSWIEGTPPDGEREWEAEQIEEGIEADRRDNLVCCMCGTNEDFEPTDDDDYEVNSEGWCVRCEDHTVLETKESYNS